MDLSFLGSIGKPKLDISPSGQEEPNIYIPTSEVQLDI
jgi:hypothetical protein